MLNIVYDGEKMNIIDFGLMTTDKPLNEVKGEKPFADIQNLILILKTIIICGSLTLNIKEWLIEESIIKDYRNINLDIFLIPDENIFHIINNKLFK